MKGYKVYGRAGAGAGIIVRTEFFFGKNQGKKLKKNLSPPLSNNFCVVSRNGGGVNFSWLNPKCKSVRPSEIGTDISHVVTM